MLRELQARLSAALLRDEADAVADLIDPARLRIHRNNLFTSLTEVLATHFPVVKRLVGDGFFAYVAHHFIAAHAPAEPRLAVYGEAFPRFLERFPPAATLVYLGDVARLEWALIAAHNAPPAPALPLTALAGIASEAIERVRLVLVPGAAWLSSPWPIDAIWAANQPERDGTLPPGAPLGLRFVQVRRQTDDRGAVTALDAATWRFREALDAGRPLADAVRRGHDTDPMFDLAVALHGLFADGLVTTLSPPPEGGLS